MNCLGKVAAIVLVDADSPPASEDKSVLGLNNQNTRFVVREEAAFNAKRCSVQ